MGLLSTWVAVCLMALTTQYITHAEENDIKKEGLLVVTVATDITDGFKRFMDSTKKYGYTVKVIGMGTEWKGGDVAKTAGGGYKVNLLRKALEPYKDFKDLKIMFTDSYDVVLTAPEEALLKSFDKFDAKVLFSAEGFCWPDASLADKYPVVKTNEKRYLNSGGFIGRASEIYKLVTHSKIADTDDDQLYYTNIFLDKKLRGKFRMKLDTRSDIFQNLNGALDEVGLKFKGSTSYLYNEKTGNTPIVAHGNGPIKPQFNSLANYLVDGWTPLNGCQRCKEDRVSLEDLKEEDYPTVMVAVFLEHPTPFAEDFFDKVGKLTYPKSRINLFIHYANEFHSNDIQNFMDKYGMAYEKVKLYGPTHGINQWDIRNKALEECVQVQCQYFFHLEGEAQIEMPELIEYLIQANRSAIGPLLVRPSKMWSNFWGALGQDGFYKRSEDYVDIIQMKKRGQWNIPYMTGAYMIHGHKLPSLLGGYIDDDLPSLDPDMAICKRMREQGMFMFIDNQEYFGHLVSSDSFDTSHHHNDLYELFDNKYTWEEKYLHKNHTHALNDEHWTLEQPCPDVYWFPLFTDKLCDDLIEEMEKHGQWSGGGHEGRQDQRLDGGYENVPTVDIHTNQIGWEKHWLEILKTYVAPLSNSVYTGYYSDARAIMNFMVRYKPGEQDRLRPHHDASTYSINVAMNTAGQDFEGGGTKFHRYNCSVTAPRKGWFLMHPGRLTHIHEGLPTTRGTRYIMVSFIDP